MVQQSIEGRAVQVSTGKPSIVIVLGDARPAEFSLRRNIGFTRFSLRIQRIEFLLQPFFSGLAGIDGHPLFWVLNHRSAPHKPKNLGPDQRAPVMARAMADNDLNVLPS